MRTEEFNHIILPMRSNLKAYALRLTESDDNAEDLVQEVMLRLWDMRLNIKAEDNGSTHRRPAGRATGRGKPHQTDSGTASALAAADIPHEGDRRLYCR